MKDNTKSMREYQRDRIEYRVKVLSRILDDMKKKEIRPKHFTAITRYLSSRYLEITGEVISDSTLRRSEIYKQLIHDFMKYMGYESAKSEKIMASNNVQLQMLVHDLKKENDYLKKRNQVLNSEISSLDFNQTHKGEIVSIDNSELDVAASAIYKIIKEFSLIIDLQNMRVFDEVSQSVYFTDKSFPYFFKWIERN